MSLPLPHRHICYNPEKPDLIDVYDDIAIIGDRAKSIIHLVQKELLGDRTLDDSVLFEALEAIRDGVLDIEVLLSHFVDSQTNQPQKKP